MHYELDLTTSPLRGTPPKNSFVIFKRRVLLSLAPLFLLFFFEKQEESFATIGREKLVVAWGHLCACTLLHKVAAGLVFVVKCSMGYVVMLFVFVGGALISLLPIARV